MISWIARTRMWYRHLRTVSLDKVSIMQYYNWKDRLGLPAGQVSIESMKTPSRTLRRIFALTALVFLGLHPPGGNQTPYHSLVGWRKYETRSRYCYGAENVKKIESDGLLLPRVSCQHPPSSSTPVHPSRSAFFVGMYFRLEYYQFTTMRCSHQEMTTDLRKVLVRPHPSPHGCWLFHRQHRQ